MRKPLAALAVLALAAVFGSGAWAQDANRRSGDQQNQNQSDTQVIRGVVAEIAADGELAIDYRTNKAVMVEAAYLTVVGSPRSGQAGAATASSGTGGQDRRDQGQAKGDSSGRTRDNVYVVWLTPRTKILKTSDDARQKTEASLDQLDVGDRVELRLTRRAESDTGAASYQSAQMRGKHGRDRIVFGDASEITILPPRNDARSSSNSQDPSKAGSDNRNRER